MPTSIKVENLSKLYRLGEIGTGTISQDVHRWFTTKVMGQEDPFLKIGQSNDRTTKGESDLVYSLQDINFEIEQGDAVGIIGRNGAGKSTLLKILSRVTAPTTGRINIKGRVASLLEVGTGFHPELTGRENIFLNGTILGMRKKEIARKLDEIIDFSGVERYVDTPVKRYSSGMYVRLAFAVAAHLESEILIVDEVLAVGDAEFQKKCLGKMGDVSKGEGRTILFVSHNMASLKALCQKGILLENGQMVMAGGIHETVQYYMGGSAELLNYRKLDAISDGFKLASMGIRNAGESFDQPIMRDKEIRVEFEYENNVAFANEFVYFNLKFKDDEGKYLMVSTSSKQPQLLGLGPGKTAMVIPANFFNEGSFFVDFMVIARTTEGFKALIQEADVLNFQIHPEQRPLGAWMGKEVGYIRHVFEWQ